MSTTDCLFAVAQAAVVSLLAGGLFWLVLRNYRGVAPNTHRWVWFGVLLLGLCVLRCPIDVPFYDAEARGEREEVRGGSVLIPDQTVRELPLTYDSPLRVPQFEPRSMSHNALEKITPIEPQPVIAEPKPTIVSNNESVHEPGTVFPEIIIGVWLAGVVILLVRRLILFVQLHLRLRSLQKGTAPDWERLLAQFGVAPEKIPVLWTDNAGPALVRSMFGYRLLFPRSLWDELSPTHRDGVLRHELSHYYPEKTPGFAGGLEKFDNSRNHGASFLSDVATSKHVCH